VNFEFVLKVGFKRVRLVSALHDCRRRRRADGLDRAVTGVPQLRMRSVDPGDDVILTENGSTKGRQSRAANDSVE
jgi:hypothetical protein